MRISPRKLKHQTEKDIFRNVNTVATRPHFANLHWQRNGSVGINSSKRIPAEPLILSNQGNPYLPDSTCVTSLPR